MRLVTTLLHSAYHYHLWIILAVSSETYKSHWQHNLSAYKKSQVM